MNRNHEESSQKRNLANKGSGAFLLQFVVFGVVTGSLAGVFDLYLGWHRLALPPILGLEKPVLVGISIGLLALPGALWGALLHTFYTQGIVRLVSLSLSRPRRTLLLVFGGLAFVCTSTAVAFWGKQRGIQVDAIDYRPVLLCAGATAVSGLVVFLFHRYARALMMLAILFVCGALVVSILSLSKLKGTEGVVPFVANQTVLLRPVLSGLRTLFDRDGDGYPTQLCENDCDCMDNDRNVFPSAREVIGNGIDEDCSGRDLLAPGAESKPVGHSPRTGSRDSLQFGDSPLNIVLITIDCLRADHLSFYGYPRETSPHLNRFAAESTLFQQVRAAGPSTRHSFPALLTGRYFSSLALKKGKKWFELLPENTTFAEHLGGRGYRTHAVLPYFRFKEKSGFNQGFDTWTVKLKPGRHPIWDPTADLVTDRGLALLKEVAPSKIPWLIWLHYFDPHASYVRHGKNSVFGNTRVDLYDGEIHFTDSHIHRFLEGLRAKISKEKVVVIIAGDHGEALEPAKDHGFLYHGFSLFDSEIRVPLIIQSPQSKPASISRPVGLIDIAPTVLDFAGIPAPPEMQGVSLVPDVYGERPGRRPTISELPDGQEAVAIVDWPYKLIWYLKSNTFALFHLQDDPLEKTDLHRRKPVVTEQLVDRLRRFRSDYSHRGVSRAQ